MSYVTTEDPKDPIQQTLVLLDSAESELLHIGLGPVGPMQRAAIDRAKQCLKAALARLADAEQASRPPVVHRHPGGEAAPSA